MNRVQRSFQEKITDPSIAKLAGMVIGTLIKYSPKHQLASVNYTTTEDESVTTKDAVPVMFMVGMKSSGPFPGDSVLIGFLNNSFQQPVILGVVDKEHALRTRPMTQSHVSKGGNIPDYYDHRQAESWEEEELDWIVRD